MAFTNIQKVETRRYCGYSLLGGQPIQAFGWRFITQYGHMEYVMNNMAPEEYATAEDIFLSKLRTLEAAIPTASDNLDTDRAAVWYHNKREVQDREMLFTNWRLKYCAYLGVEPGPLLSNVGRVVFAI